MSQKKKGGGRPVLGPLVAADEVRAPTKRDWQEATGVYDYMLSPHHKPTPVEVDLIVKALTDDRYCNQIKGRIEELEWVLKEERA